MPTVVLAEADKKVRKRLREILKEDHEVAVASDGVVALEKILDIRPDLVILDLLMPKMDGLEVLRRIREATDDLRVVVLAGSMAEVPQAIALGATDYLVKPIHGKLLRHRLKLVARSHLPITPRALKVVLSQLHDPRTGRLDGDRIANYMGVHLKQLAEALGANYTTVHKTPDAPSLQEGLRPIKRCLDILATTIEDEARLHAWLNSPHPDLNMRAPIDVILSGRIGALLTILENALAGIPT